MTLAYEEFLAQKVAFGQRHGFDIDPALINPILKPHQADIVRWAVHGGRRAIFAAFGLGKSVMQLEALRLITDAHQTRALIVAPLGVRQEFRRDAAMLGLDIRFVRGPEQVDRPGLYLTNYETVRDGRLDPDLFGAVSLDEASILRSYGSKTYQTFLPLFDAVPYRFVATATPSPNRYKELIHYAGFLGVMDTGQALTRFFQRDSTKANHLTLYPHKTVEFHLWLNTWACFIQRPSDLSRCQCHVERNSKANGSATWSSSPGNQTPSATGRGSADATAARLTSPRPTTSPQAASSAADASDPSTAGKAPAPMTSGKGSSTAAPARSTRTGTTTAVEASASATAGSSSPTSSPTWDSRPPAPPSTGSTTTGTTSPATAGGPPGPSRHATPAAPSSSPTPAEPSRSQPGQQSSGSPTGNSTAGSSSSDGLPSEPSSCCRDCRCDDGYDLPPLDVRWHEVAVDHTTAVTEPDGQGRLFRGGALGVSDAAREKRDTLPARVAKLRELVDEAPDDHFLLWHDLEDERRAIKTALPEAVEIYGTLDLDERERRVVDFSDGRIRLLATKPELSGSGCNFQRHCHRAVFAGVGFKFNDFIQSIHRLHRFLQPHPVRVDVIYAESEREVVANLRTKWEQHKEITANMSDVIRTHGLSDASITAELTRSMGVEREQTEGDGWLVALNDCVPETAAMDEASVDLIVTSIPFSNHYEYTPSYNDFGHTDGNSHFWAQMDYLTPQLLRVLAPGRIYACHVKDRILFGNVTGAGLPTVSPFHAEAIAHGIRHGFDYLGMITVVTDVVRENNQTYRLSWSEQCKDGTKMGVGSPEYVLLFHKPQSDRSRGYADRPVTKTKAEYPIARWQLDAHAFWRSSGDRPLTPEELAQLPHDQLSRVFTDQTLRQVYDYEAHVETGEALGPRLPKTFMSLQPGSHHPDVWHDVNRMLTLNAEQARRAQTNHVCPLQFDIVDRLINRYSNPGDLIYDPFGGLFTVPLRAVMAGRRGRACELNSGYYADGVRYLRAHDARIDMPSLFDLTDPSAAPSSSTKEAV